MRHALLCLFTSALMYSTYGQVTTSISVGLADDLCTDINDPDNCFAVPDGQDSLIYSLVQASDIVITYRVSNNTNTTIEKISIQDDEYGLVLPTTNVSVGNGATYTHMVRQSALTATGLTEIMATWNLGDGNSNTLILDDNYYLNAIGPMVDASLRVGLGSDICTDETDILTCGSSIDDNDSLTIGAGRWYYIEFPILNTGIDTLINHLVVDEQNNTLSSTAFKLRPDGSLIMRDVIQAPDIPGTYNLVATYTSEDQVGNQVSVDLPYVIIVPEPMVDASLRVGLGADICTDETDIFTCGSSIDDNDSLTIGAGRWYYIEFPILNTGIDTLINHLVVDEQNNTLSSTAFKLRPDGLLIMRDVIQAPDIPGTYNFVATYTSEDQVGNQVSVDLPYVIIVPEPMVDASLRVGLGADICTDETDILTCGSSIDDNDSLTIGAGRWYYIEFPILNTGIDTLINHHVVDEQNNALSNTAFKLRPTGVIIMRDVIQAPEIPGTYNLVVTYTSEDQVGNQVSVDLPYVITVPEPMVDASLRVGLGSDICTDETDILTCGSSIDDNDSLTIGAGRWYYIEFPILNTGIDTLINHLVIDEQNNTLSSTAFKLRPTGSIIMRDVIEAPDIPGTYNFVATYTSEDQVGNQVSVDLPYVITVDCRLDDVAPPEAICQDLSLEIPPTKTATITPGQINNGSFDGCTTLAGGFLNRTQFSCADMGPNTVVLTVEDQNRNQSTCDATVTVELPTAFVVDAGADMIICSDRVELAPLAFSQGTGAWKVTEGSATLTETLPNGNVIYSGTAGDSIELTWTQDYGDCTSSDALMVHFTALPTTADAGENQDVIDAVSTTLTGNTPTVGEGLWTILQGPSGGSFVDATDPETTFSGTLGAAYLLQWTISNSPCGSSTDLVTIEFSSPQPPDPAVAGEDIISCDRMVELSAQAIQVGTGSWSILNGNGGFLTSPASPSSRLVGDYDTTYELEWTTTNDGLISKDTVVVRIVNNNEIIDDQYLQDWSQIDSISGADSITIKATFTNGLSTSFTAEEVTLCPGVEVQSGTELVLISDSCVESN